MFESFSSRANQTAVDKLIQLATGKKGPAAEEEERPEPEGAEAPREPAEASAAMEQAPVTEPAAESAAEEVQSAPSEAPVETPVEEQPATEEPVDDRPFFERVLGSPTEAPSAEAAAPPAEAVVEAAPEAPVEEPPVEEPVAEPQPEAAAEAPAEPAEEPATAAPPPAPEPVSEPVAERAPAEPEEAQPEPVAASAEPTVENRPSPEAATEAPARAAAEDSAPAEEEKATSAETTEDAVPQEPQTVAAEAAADEKTSAGPKAGEKASQGKGGQDDPFDLERFRQRQAERRRGRGADIFPSPDETTFLRSRYRDSPRDEVTEEELKTLSRDPMWKTLIQFKGWLPVVTRVLPLLDLAGRRASSGNTEEIKDSVEGLLVSNRDMRTTLQNQTVEFKRVEEEVARLREASDKSAFEQNAISEDVRGIQRLMKHAFLYLGILLGLMVVAVGYMGFLVFRYLNHPMH